MYIHILFIGLLVRALQVVHGPRLAAVQAALAVRPVVDALRPSPGTRLVAPGAPSYERPQLRGGAQRGGRSAGARGEEVHGGEAAAGQRRGRQSHRQEGTLSAPPARETRRHGLGRRRVSRWSRPPRVCFPRARPLPSRCAWRLIGAVWRRTWLRTNGFNTNGAAAKVIVFDRLRKTGTPWQFWEDKSRLTEYPKSPSVKNMKFAVTPSLSDGRLFSVCRGPRGRRAGPPGSAGEWPGRGWSGAQALRTGARREGAFMGSVC